jgi:hypothetical protein
MPTSAQKPDRTKLFRYLTGEQSGQYRQIMGLFAGPLLGDLSSADVAARLGATGGNVSLEEAAARCEALEKKCNLIRGVRDARVPTVKDYLRSRTRYQASKLGGRVHRDAEAVLAAGDGAREVARESTHCSRPNWSATADRGRTSTTSRSPSPSTSTGSTSAGSTGRSA